MRTYCISDIHGHYENLERFMDTLEEDDRVYVLGDVIDKGLEPIKCLKTIMKDKRFTMLLGNHEHMMYDYLSSKNNYLALAEARRLWLEWNGGYATLDPYMELSEYEQDEIFTYIRNLPINIPDLEVNGKHFYLVHAFPASDKEVSMKDLDFDPDKIGEYIWERREPSEEIETFGKTAITGHSACQEYLGYNTEIHPVSDEEDLKKASFIDIDGGLAYGVVNSRLIALCLDDMSYKTY